MVLLADGPEGDVMHIQARDNLDIGGQVMITEGEGKKLRELLNRFQEKSLSFIHPKDSLLRVSIRHNLDTEAPKAVDGEFKSWESSKFEGIPLVGVVTMLTFYQANVLSTESDVIRYLYSSIDAESFKFNKLEALVIPDSRYVLTGDRLRHESCLQQWIRPSVQMLLSAGVPYRIMEIIASIRSRQRKWASIG